MTASPKPERKATRQKITFGQLITSFFVRHVQTAIGTCGRLYRNPISSLLTIMVIGIALALPSGLYLTLKNFQSILGEWNPTPKISLYLNSDVSEQTAVDLTRELGARSEITSSEYISPDNGLREIADTTGITNIVDILGENPLPRVIVLVPTDQFISPLAIGPLHEELKRLPGVNMARLDLKWVQRLAGYIAVAERGLWAITLMLGLAVLLIVGNTIRLEIFNRKDEIITCKLIGATNSFIRRPFLYSGFWFGITGGVFAWISVTICVFFVSAPVAALAASYNSPYQLVGLSLQEASLLISLGLILGLIGSFASVTRHLKRIEPE